MAAPTISSTSPGTDATSVSIYKDVLAVFDIPIKFLRHDQSNEPLVFTLKDHTGTTVLQRKTDDSLPITCVFNDVTRTARLRVFVSLNALKYSETYTASISAAKGLDGTTMTTHSWSFTTEADPSAAPSVSPPVADYSIWFAADKLVGYSNGDPVTALTDSSTNSNDAAQATQANQGTYAASAVNSLPAVAFDGSSTFYTTGAATVGTVFIVCNHTDGSAFTDYRRIFDASDSAGWAIFGNSGTSDYNPSYFERDIAANHIWVNGVQTESALPLASFKVVSGVLTDIKDLAVSIGTLDGGGSQYLKGNIAEYIFYPTQLSDSDRQSVESYLMTKYAIS